MLKKRPVPEITELVCHSDITLGCLHEHALLLQTQGVKQCGPAQYRTVVYTLIAPHKPIKGSRMQIFIFNLQSPRWFFVEYGTNIYKFTITALLFVRIINASTGTTSTENRQTNYLYSSFNRN
jgi:hypothetical protein